MEGSARLLALCITTTSLYSCMALEPLMTQPTLDATKAPFQATTDVTNGTSQGVSDLTRPTKEFTSSTSPKSWFTGEGLVKAEYQVLTFTVFNFNNLRDDIARGHGEYVSSLASLVEVPPDRKQGFYVSLQNLYPMVYGDGVNPSESVNRLMHELKYTP